MKRIFFEAIQAALWIALLHSLGCAHVDPVTPPKAPALVIDCGVPSTRAQMAEAMPILARCVQAEAAVGSCVSNLQTSYTLDALLCAERSRGMAAYRAVAEGTATPGEQHEAEAVRDWFRDQEQNNGLRFKY